MRSYEAARTLFGFLAFCAWSVVVIGLISAMVTGTAVSQYAGSNAGFAAAIPGIGLAITGLLLLAFVQMGRASVDTAEYTQQMLKISRDQLEVSRQVLNQGNSSTSGFAGTIKKAKPSLRHSMYARTDQATNIANAHDSDAEREIQHNGFTIQDMGNCFQVDSRPFERIEHAKNYIDNILVPERDKVISKKLDY